MRQQVFQSGVIINYPEQRVFAFSPYYAEIVGTAINQEVTFTFLTYTLKRYTDANSKVIIPLQGLFQAFFNGYEFGDVNESIADHVNNNTLTMILSQDINVVIGTNEFNMSFDIIWGALQIGEEEPTIDTIYAFGSLPLTYTQNIGLGFSDLQAGDTTNYDNYHNNLSYGKEISIIPSFTNGIPQALYLKESTTVVKTINIKGSTCTEGYYLRWLDLHGNYRYMLFNFGKEEVASKAGATFNYNRLSLDPINKLQKQFTQMKNKSVAKAVTAAIPSADEAKTTHCLSLLGSLKQWLYLPEVEQWLEVNVADMTISKVRNEGNREIQVKIIYPDYYTQSL